MAVPREKRRKTDDMSKSIVWSIISNAMTTLHSAIESTFCLLSIRNCNASYSVPFTQAFCATTTLLEMLPRSEEENRKVFNIMTLFENGNSVLTSFLQDPNWKPSRTEEQSALDKLINFFCFEIADVEESLYLYNEAEETEWAIRLTHHLLSKLSVSPRYVMDKCSTDTTSSITTCSCCQTNLTGEFGDTSIGAQAGWHGNLDIILGGSENPEVPIKIAVQCSYSPGGSQANVEMDDFENCRNQILAETIVFSFLQKTCHPEYSNYLVPLIAISKTHVKVFMYDCEKDILLEGCKLPLFNAKGKLVDATVIILWLAFNYKYLGSGVPNAMEELGFKANFAKKLDDADDINIYDKHIGVGCGTECLKEKDYDGSMFTYGMFTVIKSSS